MQGVSSTSLQCFTCCQEWCKAEVPHSCYSSWRTGYQLCHNPYIVCCLLKCRLHDLQSLNKPSCYCLCWYMRGWWADWTLPVFLLLSLSSLTSYFSCPEFLAEWVYFKMHPQPRNLLCHWKQFFFQSPGPLVSLPSRPWKAIITLKLH